MTGFPGYNGPPHSSSALLMENLRLSSPQPSQSSNASIFVQSKSHKTEKAKMLNGDPFLPFDEELFEERARCASAVYTFNNIATTPDEGEFIFWRILTADGTRAASQFQHGNNFHIATPFHCDYGYNLTIGDDVSIGTNCILLDSAPIEIGRNTRIGASVTISTMKTPTDPRQRKGTTGTEISRPVRIGNNVYIGNRVIIEAGVSIGDNAIIGPGSLVSDDIV
ncbi:trimeric LpxA-like protein [Phaeosphaeriaceae sp. PMI808]|nr:trimeric LpxA-like protein [Phaeosphaeriaceae sp. PMI808]